MWGVWLIDQINQSVTASEFYFLVHMLVKYSLCFVFIYCTYKIDHSKEAVFHHTDPNFVVYIYLSIQTNYMEQNVHVGNKIYQDFNVVLKE